MIGLLDPALFLPRQESEVVGDFDALLQTCQAHQISVPDLSEYWPQLWSQLGSQLERSLTPGGRRTVQQVRRLGQTAALRVPPLAPGVGAAWRRGFQQLFGAPLFVSSWEDEMAAAAVRAAATGAKVILLTRRMVGRNTMRHAAGHSTLDENTRWYLHLQPQGLGPVHVLCVHHQRNITEPWTARFDWRLPGARQGARYPFCCPEAWWKRSTIAVRTISSKPAWADRAGNGWARPNIPGGTGYHWDVFIQAPALQRTVGLDQINVVEFGAPANEGRAGHIHHVPEEKAGRITNQGWTCADLRL